MSAVIGIDLGTTNTVVGAVIDGRATTLPDRDGNRLIPSVVAFPPGGQVLVGSAARERRLQDAANTVFSIKRLIGRSWGSPEVEVARARFPFTMLEGPGLATLVSARGQSYTLPEISAFVLKKAKSVAEEALGEAVERAIITVPASFNDLQRAATKVAGRVAGLEVLRILNEPTAAALAHGYGKGHAERIAVYDFGGGTFDVTLIDLSGNVFEVLSTAGDSFLGGDDIDDAIADVMAKDFLVRYRHDARASAEGYDQLRLAAEQLKVRLGDAESATAALDGLAIGPGGKSIDAVFTFTRPELERLAAPVVERTFRVCEEALQIAGLGVRDLDQVLLVGGSARLPLVRRRVAEFFGREPQVHAVPDEVVALGAAIQASALTASRKRQPPVPAPPLPKAAAPAAPAARPRQRTLLGAGRLPARPELESDSIPNALAARPPPVPPRLEAQGVSPAQRPADDERTGERARRLQQPAPSLSEPEAPARPLEASQWRPAPPPPPLRTTASATSTETAWSSAPGALPFAPAALGQSSPPNDEGHAPPAADDREHLIGAIEADENVWLPFPSRPPSRPDQTIPLDHSGASDDGSAALSQASPPLLLDVTPLSLSVETVGGYCDVLVERNSKLPSSHARVFVTSTDNQRTIAVRVCQGESRRFAENTALGEVVLDGLREAQRGEIAVEIRFALDSDGMLGVNARDLGTQREASVRLHLIGITDSTKLDELARRHAMHQIR